MAVEIVSAYKAGPHEQGTWVGGIMIGAKYPWTFTLKTLYTDDCKN